MIKNPKFSDVLNRSIFDHSGSNSFSMVQARKETPDHVSVREKCLNYSCPKESSLVGINKAILKVKNFGRGICKLIFFIRVVCLSEVLLVDGAVEYNP
jgi:hypothetical protein